jgi:hypothetical protein
MVGESNLMAAYIDKEKERSNSETYVPSWVGDPAFHHNFPVQRE